jgi:hypothetical protein
MMLATSPPAVLLILALTWALRTDVSGARGEMENASMDRDATEHAEQAQSRHRHEVQLMAQQSHGNLSAVDAAQLRALREQDRADSVVGP